MLSEDIGQWNLNFESYHERITNFSNEFELGLFLYIVRRSPCIVPIPAAPSRPPTSICATPTHVRIANGPSAGEHQQRPEGVGGRKVLRGQQPPVHR